jgi:protein-disulfide isomerase
MTFRLAAPRVLGLAVALVVITQGSSCGRAEPASRAPARGDTVGSTGATAAAPAAAPADSAARSTADRARVRGDSGAGAWMVMVSDFQCPYCKMWHDSTQGAIEREYVTTGKLRLAYVNFPLPSHKNAWPAAEAAMCAGAQGKFWAMHDALFAEQERWSRLSSPEAFFDTLAVRAGVDSGALRRCVSSGVMRPLIQADFDRSSSAGINSTPTFIVGDSVIEGAYPVARFRAVIDAALAKR